MGNSQPLTLDYVPLDEKTLPKHVLDIESKTRTNPMPWKGQFSPQLIQAFLGEYASAGNRVLDPFVGSGTVLAEAAAHQLAATGVEINPAAYALSRVYELSNLSADDRELASDEVAGGLRSADVGSITERERLETSLLAVRDTLKCESQRTLMDASLVLSDFGGLRFDIGRFRRTWLRLLDLIATLPSTPLPIRAVHSDARAIPCADSSFDLVITSPPYINVFNYHQQFRPAVELLGWNVLRVARSEFGSNRKNRSNRFLTVIQYCLDLSQTLVELCRVSTEGARIIVVVGRESTVRGMTVRNGELLLNLAVSSVGLRVESRQERQFVNRFGQIIVEDILHFTATKAARMSPDIAVALAVACLEDLVSLAQVGEVRSDIEQAVLDANAVKASPLYDPPVAQHRYVHPSLSSQ